MDRPRDQRRHYRGDRSRGPGDGAASSIPSTIGHDALRNIEGSDTVHEARGLVRMVVPGAWNRNLFGYGGRQAVEAAALRLKDGSSRFLFLSLLRSQFPLDTLQRVCVVGRSINWRAFWTTAAPKHRWESWRRRMTGTSKGGASARPTPRYRRNCLFEIVIRSFGQIFKWLFLDIASFRCG
jgi:hypothetical protein